MNRERNALKAGIFIVISFIACVAAVVLIRGEGSGKTQERTVAFSVADDLGGLTVGDDVRIGGVKVGTVRDIEFDALESTAPKVLVRFSIPAQYVLHEDAKIGVQTALTGPANLNITRVGSGKLLADGQALTGIADPKSLLASALPKVNDALASFKQTADSANELVRHINGKIDPIVSEYDAVAKNTAESMGQIRDLVGDSKTDFRGTVKNLNEATASIKAKLPGIIDKVDAVMVKVDDAVSSAKTALEDVKKSAANIRDVSASARSVVVDNRTRLDTMIKSLKTTSDNLKATSVEVRHSPWRLLYKPGPDEMANLNLYDTARQFAEGAGSLEDASAALRDAMKDPNVDKDQLKKLIEHLDESFKNFHTAEGKLWSSVKQ